MVTALPCHVCQLNHMHPPAQSGALKISLSRKQASDFPPYSPGDRAATPRPPALSEGLLPHGQSPCLLMSTGQALHHSLGRFNHEISRTKVTHIHKPDGVTGSLCQLGGWSQAFLYPTP